MKLSITLILLACMSALSLGADTTTTKSDFETTLPEQNDVRFAWPQVVPSFEWHFTHLSLYHFFEQAGMESVPYELNFDESADGAGNLRGTSVESNVASYPLVNIVNSTPYYVTGTVHYASAFCSNDNFSVDSQKTWTAKSRGVCLVTKITASVKVTNGAVSATPYTSSGTSYSSKRAL